MIELLEFIFSDFWHFLGVCILMVVAGWSLSLVSSGFGDNTYAPVNNYDIKTDKDVVVTKKEDE